MVRVEERAVIRIALLEARFHAFRADVLKWQLEHNRHHEVGEARWGLVALMRAHPFRTLAVGLAVGSLLVGGLNIDSWRALVQRWLWP